MYYKNYFIDIKNTNSYNNKNIENELKNLKELFLKKENRKLLNLNLNKKNLETINNILNNLNNIITDNEYYNIYLNTTNKNLNKIYYLNLFLINLNKKDKTKNLNNYFKFNKEIIYYENKETLIKDLYKKCLLNLKLYKKYNSNNNKFRFDYYLTELYNLYYHYEFKNYKKLINNYIIKLLDLETKKEII